MNDETRLLACFRHIFPRLTDAEIRDASMRTLGTWDSAALMRLITRVEREFAVRFDRSHVNGFVSFAAALAILRALRPPRPAPSEGPPHVVAQSLVDAIPDSGER